MPISKRSRGFTLVEIAIVTMIVGLLIGGILKGQELVGQARAKNLINDFIGVQASVLSYRDRYNAWPGDDQNAGGASGRWSTFGTKSGNGDGRVGGNYNDLPTAGESSDPTTLVVDATTGSGESKLFWWHLRIAGFVTGSYSGPGAAILPTTAAGGILGIQTGSTVANFFPGLMACADNVPDRIAVTVDAQLDDIRPATGQIRALKQNGPGGAPPLASSTAVTDYIEDGSRYTLCRQL